MPNLKLEFLQAELVRVSDWIKFSDRKVAFLSVYYSFFLGLFFSQKSSISENLLNFQSCTFFYYKVVLLGIMISFISGIFFLFRSLFPRLIFMLKGESLFFYGSVANIEFNSFVKKYREMTKDNAEHQLLGQIYTNSQIANEKMVDVQKSIKSLAILFIFSALFLLFK